MASDINNILARYVADIEQSIKNTLTAAPPFIHGVISYHFGWANQNFEPARYDSGKMLRPVLCLLVFEALTGHHRDALPAATSVEMVHNFSLIHDDIEDGDTERRGRPTAWTIWGKPLAINVGDFLYTLAFNTIYQLDSSRFSAEQILAVQRLIIESCLVLTAGQDLDLRFEQNQQVTTAMYLDMVYKKTGALLEAAILAGATLGTTDRTIINHYRNFAHNIGIAFQVRDDILGIWGDTSQTGKSADNDLRRKKKTLPVIYLLNKADGERQARLQSLYATPDPLTDDQVEFVRRNLEWAGAHQYAQNKADGYIEDAFSALNQIKISNQAQAELETIAQFLVQRSR